MFKIKNQYKPMKSYSVNYMFIYIKKKQTETHTVADFGNLIKILAGVYVCV